MVHFSPGSTSFTFCIATLLLIFFVNYSWGGQTPQQVALSMHNTDRALHGAGPLTFDDGLNSEAQRCSLIYAQNKKIDHSCITAQAGENLYMSWYYGDMPPPDPVNTTIKGIQSWYDEKQGYNYANPGSSSGVTGHFTQMVWKATTLLGIGISTVDKYTVVVGKYKVAGNVFGSGTDGYDYYRKNVAATV